MLWRVLTYKAISWRTVCEISRCSEYVTCNELAEVADICLSQEFARSQNVRNRSALVDLLVFFRPATRYNGTALQFCSGCPTHHYDNELQLVLMSNSCSLGCLYKQT